jgi:hypothetical protein
MENPFFFFTLSRRCRDQDLVDQIPVVTVDNASYNVVLTEIVVIVTAQPQRMIIIPASVVITMSKSVVGLVYSTAACGEYERWLDWRGPRGRAK